MENESLIPKSSIQSTFYALASVAMEVVQIIISNLIEPKVMGKGSNLSPVAVLLALSLWGIIWGAVGMLLAVPITAVIVIICSQIPLYKVFCRVIICQRRSSRCTGIGIVVIRNKILNNYN